MRIIWQLIPALDLEEKKDLIRYFLNKYFYHALPHPKGDDLYNRLSIATNKKNGTIKDVFLNDPELEPLREHLELLRYPLFKNYEDYLVFLEGNDIVRINVPPEEINIANADISDPSSAPRTPRRRSLKNFSYKGAQLDNYWIIFIFIDIEKRERDMTDDAYRRLAFVRGATASVESVARPIRLGDMARKRHLEEAKELEQLIGSAPGWVGAPPPPAKVKKVEKVESVESVSLPIDIIEIPFDIIERILKEYLT